MSHDLYKTGDADAPAAICERDSKIVALDCCRICGQGEGTLEKTCPGLPLPIIHETQQSIAAWALATFGPTSSNQRTAVRAADEMRELLDALAADDRAPTAGEEIADVVIVLSRLATELGVDIAAEVDKKMSVNRSRSWSLDGTGHGQHVELPTAAPAGMWTWSHDEEVWSNEPQFATREEALAEAEHILADDTSDTVESDDATVTIWTGECRLPDVDQVTTAILGDVDDRVNEWLYDNVGEFAADAFSVSKGDQAELEQLVGDWLTRRKLMPECWVVERVQRHDVKVSPAKLPTTEVEATKRCGHVAQEMGTCPYQTEINDVTRSCECCPSCRRECAEEI